MDEPSHLPICGSLPNDRLPHIVSEPLLVPPMSFDSMSSDGFSHLGPRNVSDSHLGHQSYGTTEEECRLD